MAHASILGTLKYDEQHHGWLTRLGHACTLLQVLLLSGTHPQVAKNYIRSINQQLEQHHIGIRLPDNDEKLQESEMRTTMNKLSNQWDPVQYMCFQLGCIFSVSRVWRSTKDDIQVSQLLDLMIDEEKKATQATCRRLQIDLDRVIQRMKAWDDLSGGITDFILSQSRPLVILLVLADAKDEHRLRLGEEKRSLEETLRGTQFQDSFEVRDLPSCRPQDLQSALLRHQPRIIHFSGHGSPGGLIFEDVAGNACTVKPESMANLLRLAVRYGLEAVILNACYSGENSKPIADSVDTVIAMRGKLKDTAAVAFTRSFYNALGEGKSFDESFEWGLAGAQFESSVDALDAVLIQKPNPSERIGG